VGSIVSAIGPWAFGRLIGALDGQYWGGFLFLAAINAVGAVCYLALHRASSRATLGAVAAATGVAATRPAS
jgi:hypothetical protein